MFSASINELQSQIHYYQEQCQLAEQELDRLKMTQAFAEEAAEKVEEALEHIDTKYVDVFKEHLLSMFPAQLPQYLEEEPVVEEQSKEALPSVETEAPTKEFGPLSYYELTGRPDTRPDTYEELAPNITYSSSGRAYVGFNDRTDAEEFRDSISEPAMIGDSETMNDFKFEVKFYCTKEYIEELVDKWDDWTLEQQEELDWQEQLIRIAPDIFYDPSSSKCYMGFSNRGRATTYGAHLKEIHELYNSRYTVSKPVVVTNCKHELVIEFITEANARKLADLNLKKDLEHRSNRDITDKWTYPSEKYTSDPDFQEEDLEYSTPPYKPIPLDQVELCDVVTTGEYIKAFYEVTANKGTHLLATCLYHDSLKHREGEEDFWLTTPYLIKKG